MKHMNDPVNQPKHYITGGIETIDYIKAKLPREHFQAYCIGNVIKYVSRYSHKNGVEDLKKAQVYLQWAIQAMSRNDHQQCGPSSIGTESPWNPK